MSIPVNQLATWSNHGPTHSAEDTYTSIKRALSTYAWPMEVNYNAYLQGSYRNHTNTRGNSDVDVVVELDSSYYGNTSNLSESDLQSYNKEFSSATYDWSAFRNDVFAALSAHYGKGRVEFGTKTLKVTTSYLEADVVVCLQHRWYWNYNGYNSSNYTEGMTFFVPSENHWVINYPKQHYANGNDKNAQANQRYRRTIRIVKNMRYWLEEHKKLAPGTTSSYFIECLLCNAPLSVYELNHDQTILNILRWLHELNDEDLSKLYCQNGVMNLCGNAHEQWPIAKAKTFIRALIDMWNDWE